MNRSCKQCGQNFEITQEDLAFYEKVSPEFGEKKCVIPPPAHCPDCRRQRRLSFRNERHLYHRKCDLTGKQIISNFSPNADVPVYSHDAWWSDRWDARQFGQDIDFSRPVFEQIRELQKRVPHLSLSVWNSENSDYCNYVGNVKNSYLIFGSVYSEDCYYGSPYYSRNCVDTLVLRECERCYECIDCRQLYGCLYCQDCHSSQNLISCFDCQGCTDCIGCAGLRKKKYHVFNEPVPKEKFESMRDSLNLCDPSQRKMLTEKLHALMLKIPHRYMQGTQTENVSGNYVYQSKNVLDSYYADRCHDCRYCAQVVDLQDCHDNNFTEENELCYEYLGAYQNRTTLFSLFCNKVTDSLYCDACHHSKHLFGCIGMRNAEYCILNKQYSKEDYEKIVPRLIEHMKRTGEYGEFFSPTNSPFGYNETVAQEYFPLEQSTVEKRGWKWYDEKDATDRYLGPTIDIPQNIDDIPDDITQKILLCEVTGKPYKIIPQELQFYREMALPIPRKCPDQRHTERMALRNPRKLWDRLCAKCQKKIRTTYAPDRPEIVYCEECYLQTVY